MTSFRVRIVNVRRKRPIREPRKDKRSIQAALVRTTRQLEIEMGRGRNG